MARQTGTRQNEQRPSPLRGLGSLLLKQLLTSVILFALLLCIKNSSNLSVSRCADAFGRALKHNPNIEERAKDITERVFDIFKSKEPPQGIGGEITFQ